MLSKKLTQATPRTKREALQLSVMAHSRAQSGLDQNERNTYPRGPRYRAPDSGTAGRYASTLWSRNDANMALPPTPHSTFDMPPPFGYPNGGLSQKRRDEYYKEEDSHLGKRRRTAGGDDFRSSVVDASPSQATRDITLPIQQDRMDDPSTPTIHRQHVATLSIRQGRIENPSTLTTRRQHVATLPILRPETKSRKL